jgi:proteasome alpha subunit
MNMPFYVSPEQVMKDRADYARKGIARGRPVVVLPYDHGIAFVAENPSRALHKISEIYDRVAFAAVGKYNEYENLRVAGVRYADLRGYSYDRSDVTGRGLANAYAQSLGAVFTTENKPLEVELVVAQVADDAAGDQLYRITYDGSVNEETGFVVMGGAAETVAGAIGDDWRPGLRLADVLGLAVRALGTDPAGGEPRTLAAADLEVAVLDRQRPRRAFRRVAGALLERLLQEDDPTDDVPATDDPVPGPHDTLTGDVPTAEQPAGTGTATQAQDTPPRAAHDAEDEPSGDEPGGQAGPSTS